MRVSSRFLHSSHMNSNWIWFFSFKYVNMRLEKQTWLSHVWCLTFALGNFSLWFPATLKYPRTTLKPCLVFSKPIFNTVFMSDGGFLISCLNALWFTWFKKILEWPLASCPQAAFTEEYKKHGNSRRDETRVLTCFSAEQTRPQQPEPSGSQPGHQPNPPSKQETISFFCWEQSDLHEMWSAGDSPQYCSAATHTHTHTNPDMVAHLARYFKLILNRELNKLPYGGRGVDIRGKTRRNQSWNNDMLLMCCSSFH